MMRFRFLFLSLLSTAAALSAPASRKIRTTKSPAQAQLKVWDDVLPSEDQRAALHSYASKAGFEHRCFSRPLASSDSSGNGNNIIERTLDAILTEIEENGGSGSGSGDDDDDNDTGVNSKQYVEYWTRQEWRHIEAHADVDENLSRRFDQKPPEDDDDSQLQSKYSTTYQKNYGHRYPIYGHVLYLQVGSDVRGPTCVFPGRSSGGDLLLQSSDEQNSDEEECEANGDGGGAKQVQLVTVPAVDGRLLRFDGRDLHAVPRPTDLWMLPFVKGGAEYEPEEVWGRSVILFNVWPGDEEPPLDVALDKKEEGSAENKSTSTETDHCNSFSRWKEMNLAQKVVPSSSEPEPNKSVKVWLLGNERRRNHPLRTVPLQAPAEGGREAVREALAEKSQVTELWLRQ